MMIFQQIFSKFRKKKVEEPKPREIPKDGSIIEENGVFYTVYWVPITLDLVKYPWEWNVECLKDGEYWEHAFSKQVYFRKDKEQTDEFGVVKKLATYYRLVKVQHYKVNYDSNMTKFPKPEYHIELVDKEADNKKDSFGRRMSNINKRPYNV